MKKPRSIKVLRLSHASCLPVPSRMSRHASGCDIAAAVTEPLIIPPGQRALVPTGLILEIPPGLEVQIRPRSGLAAKHGVTVLNSPGTIDADYRGEVKVILANFGSEPFVVNRGDRIAQAVPASVAVDIDFEESESLSETERGKGGFGHTGQ